MLAPTPHTRWSQDLPGKYVDSVLALAVQRLPDVEALPAFIPVCKAFSRVAAVIGIHRIDDHGQLGAVRVVPASVPPEGHKEAGLAIKGAGIKRLGSGSRKSKTAERKEKSDELHGE
jgi:hypothetical protein